MNQWINLMLSHVPSELELIQRESKVHWKAVFKLNYFPLNICKDKSQGIKIQHSISLLLLLLNLRLI